MSAAAREALEGGRQALTGYAKRVKPDTLRKVADEILSVRDLLAAEPRLRRALTDPGRPGDDRANLAEQVLSGKVSSGALKVIVALVKGRWSTPGELRTGLETLGVDALLSAGAADGVLGDVEDELFRFGQVVSGDSELAVALTDSTASVESRVSLVRALLEGKATSTTIRLVELAVAGFGGRRFDSGLRRLLELCAEKREQRLAYVTVATLLSSDQESRLADKLSEIYGQPVAVKLTVDPQVIGGIRVQIGHDLYDGTVARRLTEAKKALAGGR
ncbi:F0F1 ATP synthase subunit delta [Stackebrandtia soli]|uniref:F0F1 ATP synthase subunit delta n=1 Tax=Stackebrandtia soli TaxID=1892856 RepID=UPI0039ED3B4E